MISTKELIGQRTKKLADLHANGEIVAAVEVSETTDHQKAMDVIRRAMKSSSKTHLVLVIRV